MIQFLARLAEPKRSMLILSALIAVKIGIQLALYQHGFLSVSADEFARGILAGQWAERPRFDFVQDAQLVWLPFEKYLNGALLMAGGDPLWTPRASVFIFSCFLLVCVYLLTYRLFDDFSVAALAGLYTLVQPWFVWLGGTPMLETYYLASAMGGFVFLLAWLRGARAGFWVWAGGCFLIASGFHLQSWLLINLANLLTLPYLYRWWRDKNWARARRLVAVYFLSNAFVLFWLSVEFVNTGKILGTLALHTDYSKWYYGGYDIPIWEKFSYYPRLVFENSSLVVWLAVAIGLFFLRREPNRLWRLFPLALAAATLALNSVANIFSGPPSAAPARYSLLHTLLLSPYLALGIARLYRAGTMIALPSASAVVRAATVALAVYAVGWGIAHLGQYPPGMPRDAIAAGRRLDARWRPGSKYLIELRYWDYLGVMLTARHYGAVVFDREFDATRRNLPSLFQQTPAVITARLRSDQIGWVALFDTQLKTRAQEMDLQPVENIGGWTIYEFRGVP